MNQYIINKFGGGVLKDDLMPHIEKRIKEQIKSQKKLIIVVSALPSVTDEILSFTKSIKENQNYSIENFIQNLKTKHLKRVSEIIKNENEIQSASTNLEKYFSLLKKEFEIFTKDKEHRKEDLLVSFGEKFSAIIFHHYLNSLNIKNRFLFAEDIPILTDDNFKNANILFEESSSSLTKITKENKDILVIPGFTGKTLNGFTTVLGRGGTDTTACFVGASLKAEKVILWKDVGGVLSADPRIVKSAKTIKEINHQEAEEAGKIIHEKAIKYLKIQNTPIEIVSIINPKQKTIIKETEIKNKNKYGAKLVSYKKDLVFFVITDEDKKENYVLDEASRIFAKHQVDIILISNTKYILQIIADNQNEKANLVFKELEEIFDKVEIKPVYMVFLIGNFNLKMVNSFNQFLLEQKVDMEISAFLYKDCKRIEAIIRKRENKPNELENIIKKLHYQFIE